MTGLPADTKFVIKDNGALLGGQEVWLTDAAGTLAFSVPMGIDAHTVEVREWLPPATIMVVR